MKALIACFLQFYKQISRDGMLTLIIVSPVFTGAAFKWGIPWAEGLLGGRLPVFTPYFLAFDIFLAALTPHMFCFAAAMVILEEIDTVLASYLAVTPVGKGGYLLSRLVFPAVFSLAFSMLLLGIFSLSPSLKTSGSPF